METIINTILLCALAGYIIYNNSQDKKETIRELTKSLLSKNIVEYAEVIPEEGEDDVIEEEDELEDIDTTDEKILIKHLKEEYADIKS